MRGGGRRGAYAPRYVREPLYGLHVQVKDACHRNGLSPCFARSTCSDRRTLAPRPRAQLPREVWLRPGRQPLQLARVPRLRQKTRQRPRFPTCEYISPRCASAPRVDLPCVAPRSLRTVTSRRSAAAQPAALTRMSMASPVRDGRGRTSLARLATPHARPLRAHAAPCRRCRAHGLRAPIAEAVAPQIATKSGFFSKQRYPQSKAPVLGNATSPGATGAPWVFIFSRLGTLARNSRQASKQHQATRKTRAAGGVHF